MKSPMSRTLPPGISELPTLTPMSIVSSIITQSTLISVIKSACRLLVDNCSCSKRLFNSAVSDLNCSSESEYSVDRRSNLSLNSAFAILSCSKASVCIWLTASSARATASASAFCNAVIVVYVRMFLGAKYLSSLLFSS